MADQKEIAGVDAAKSTFGSPANFFANGRKWVTGNGMADRIA